MTNEDAVKWIKNLKDDIGTHYHASLWRYEQTLCEIIELLKAKHGKVILCKECKYFQEGIDINGEPFTRCNCGKKKPMTWGARVKPDWFCGHAEAKDGE